MAYLSQVLQGLKNQKTVVLTLLPVLGRKPGGPENTRYMRGTVQATTAEREMFEHHVLVKEGSVRLDRDRNKKCNYCNCMMWVLGMSVADLSIFASPCEIPNVQNDIEYPGVPGYLLGIFACNHESRLDERRKEPLNQQTYIIPPAFHTAGTISAKKYRNR